MALPYYGKIESTTKSIRVHDRVHESPVTAIDHCLQELVLAELVMHGYTDVAFNGEEDTHLQFFFPHSFEREKGITVHCDPIDGTLSYVRGDNRFAVGFGLSRYVEGKHHFFGTVIYSPLEDDLFWAFENEKSSHTREKNIPRTIAARRRFTQPIKDKLQDAGYRLVNPGNAHLGIVDVALGRVGAAFYSAHVHDVLIPFAFAANHGVFPLDEKGKRMDPFELPITNGHFSRIPIINYFASKEIQEELMPILQNPNYIKKQ